MNLTPQHHRVRVENAADRLDTIDKLNSVSPLLVVADLVELAEAYRDLLRPRPLDEWHEDIGPVLWWRFPISEPPYVGTPLANDWPDPEWHTHWTPLVCPRDIIQ